MKGLTQMEKNVIEGKVIDVMDRHVIKDDTNPSIDVAKLANKLGFEVRNMEMDDSDDGLIIVGDGVKLICINKDRSVPEKRFIIAHELGHFFLNPKSPIINFREKRHGRSEDENDIDYFAACLLMPKEIFIESYNKVKTLLSLKDDDLSYFDVSKILARLFVVPEMSALRRLKELELITIAEK